MDENIKLIEAVKGQEALYKGGISIPERTRIWKLLGHDLNLPGDNVKIRWHMLQEQYKYECLLAKRKPSGKIKFRYAKEMSFVRPYINICEEEEPDEEPSSNLKNPEFVITKEDLKRYTSEYKRDVFKASADVTMNVNTNSKEAVVVQAQKIQTMRESPVEHENQAVHKKNVKAQRDNAADHKNNAEQQKDDEEADQQNNTPKRKQNSTLQQKTTKVAQKQQKCVTPLRSVTKSNQMQTAATRSKSKNLQKQIEVKTNSIEECDQPHITVFETAELIIKTEKTYTDDEEEFIEDKPVKPTPQSIKEEPNNEKGCERSEDDIFGELVTAMLKKMPADKKRMVKRDIMNILYS